MKLAGEDYAKSHIPIYNIDFINERPKKSPNGPLIRR